MASFLGLATACTVGDFRSPDAGTSGNGTDIGNSGNGMGSGNEAGNGSGNGSGSGSGSGNGSGSGSGGGGQSFNSIVKPLVAVCVGCHSGGTPPTLTSFATLEAKYKVKPGASNILVTKGAHQGPALSAADRATIAGWIDSL